MTCKKNTKMSTMSFTPFSFSKKINYELFYVKTPKNFAFIKCVFHAQLNMLIHPPTSFIHTIHLLFIYIKKLEFWTWYLIKKSQPRFPSMLSLINLHIIKKIETWFNNKSDTNNIFTILHPNKRTSQSYIQIKEFHN